MPASTVLLPKSLVPRLWIWKHILMIRLFINLCKCFQQMKTFSEIKGKERFFCLFQKRRYFHYVAKSLWFPSLIKPTTNCVTSKYLPSLTNATYSTLWLINYFFHSPNTWCSVHLIPSVPKAYPALISSPWSLSKLFSSIFDLFPPTLINRAFY